MQGQRKSQLHVSKYCPLTCQGLVAMICLLRLDRFAGPPTDIYNDQARRVAESPGSAMTSAPRSTSATPATRAVHAPAGSAFSAKTTAAMSSAHGSDMAPAATSTTMSPAQQ